MTISTETARNAYVATAGQTIFAYSFRITNKEHLAVYQNGSLLTLTTHYTVSNVGAAGGGNVTLVTGATVNDTITILRGIPLKQETDYVENDAFPAQTHEDAMDLMIMALQEFNEIQDRGLRLGPASTYTGLTLPDPVAGKVLAWKSDLSGLENVTAGGAGSGDNWSDVVDADIIPDADGTRDLGATATRFAEMYTDALWVTNNITVGGTVDGRDIAVDGTKLDGIEAGADVTDTTNVTAAGALMDSEVDANIKTLTLPASTTISAFGATLVDDATAADARTTLGVDAAGTDNSTDVTLAGTPDYITISGQVITRNQIDLTTDVTGLLPTGNIADEAITLAKMAHVATARILGRTTAGTGDVESMTAAQVRTLLNVENGATADQSDAEIQTAYENAISFSLDGGLVINESGAAVDMRAESDNNTHKLFLDGSADALQVGCGKAATALADIGGVLYSSVTATGTDADTAEKTLQTYTIPADTFHADGQGIRISFRGVTSANTNTKQLRVKFGGNTIYDGGAYTPTSAYWIMFEIEIYRDGTSNFIAYTPALCWNNENVAVMYTSGISATETSSIVVEVTGQNGTALANEIIIDNFNVQYIAKD